MCVHDLKLEGGRKGFGPVNPARRAKYDRLPLDALKSLVREFARAGRDDLETEYVRHNLQLIQLARGVI